LALSSWVTGLPTSLSPSDVSITLEDIPEEVRFPTATEMAGGRSESKGSFKNILKDKPEEIEKDMIMKVLKESGGNVSKAALQLGVSRKGLQLKMANITCETGYLTKEE